MKTILVASDLSERSDVALNRAITLAAAAGAHLHVAHVVDGELPPDIAAAEQQGAERFLRGQLAKSPAAAQIDTEVSAVLGDPCDDVAALAQRISADLIVVGRHRHRGLAEFFSGTTVDRMARTATLPLLVVTRPADAPYGPVVVGIDLSACAARALDLAGQVAGKVVPVHAYHVPFRALIHRGHPQDALSDPDRARIEATLRNEIDAWAAPLGLQDTLRDIRLSEGGATNVLPRVAAEVGADLICLGAHSRAWLPAAMLGSIARDLLSFSDLDILIAPL